MHRHDKFGVARLVAVLSHALRLEKHNSKKPRCYGIFETGGVRILKRGWNYEGAKAVEARHGGREGVPGVVLRSVMVVCCR